MNLADFSLRRKLIGLQLVTAFIVLLCYGIFLGINDLSLHRDFVISRMESLAQLIGANSASALLFMDNATATEILSSLSSEPDIANAWICDRDGAIFATYAQQGYKKFTFPQMRKESCVSSGTFITCTKLIRKDDETAGTISIRLNMREKLVQSVTRSVIVAMLVLVIGLAVTFLLSIYSQRHIADPIMRLAGTVERVSETGDYSLRVSHDGTDEIGTLYGGFNNMMEQIQVREKAREKSEQRFTTLVANIPGATFRCRLDADWTMEFISDEIRNISGYPATDFLNNAVRTFNSIIHHDDRDGVARTIQAAVDARKPYNIEYRVIHADGGRRWVNERGQGIYNEQGGVAWIDGAIFDVSDKKAAQRQTEMQQQQLIQADKMASLGILVSGVAHEINNPNNFIQLNSDNLRDIWSDTVPLLDKYREQHGPFNLAGLPYEDIREETGPMIGSIGEGAERIKRIVQSLKDFARQDPGRMNEAVRVNDIIESAILILNNLIKKSTDHFTVDLGSDIPEIRGNIQQIEQVIINLITNACQALPDKKRAVMVNTAYDTDAASISIIIEDEGTGISPENLKHIMDPFFTTKRDAGGTGLGLSISFSIIQEHGGDLNLASEPDRGTRAVITLPVA